MTIINKIKHNVKIKLIIFNTLFLIGLSFLYLYLNNIGILKKLNFFGFIGSAVIVVTINLVLFYILMHRHIKKIIAETDSLGRENLGHTIDIKSLPSELSPLARNLNRMAENFQRDSATLKNRLNELTTIYKLNAEIAITLNLNQVMDTAKRSLKSIIDFYKILIYIKDNISNNYQLASGINLSLTDPLELDSDNELIQLAIQLNDAVVLNQFPEMMKGETKNENWEILSPMIVNKETVGIIKIEIDEGKTVDEDIVRLIKTLTTQIGIGIQNAKLYGELEQKVTDQTLELRKSYDIIFSQKEELQTIIRSIGDPLVVTNEDYCIEMVNDSFKRVFNIPDAADYLNAPIGAILNITAIKEFFLDNRDKNKNTYTKEIKILPHPDFFSEEKYFIISSALIIQDDRAKRYVTVFRDITEEKKLDKMKTDFVSTVSHELRTPLTSIKAFAKILLADKNSEEKDRREFLTIIDNEADRLTRLINDILDLSKLEAGKLEFDFKPLDIVETIRLQVKSLYSIIQQEGLKISLRRQNVPEVIADKDRIIQVINNILSNAIKFTQTNGKISITIKNVKLSDLLDKRINMDAIKNQYPLIDETHNYVEIKIEDTGVGISRDNLKKIFDKFKQIGDTLTDKPQGTGLGLPICKQIMESHQGNIWAESTLKQGTTFYFSLPVYSKKNKKEINVKKTATVKKVLLVDKDEEYRKSLTLQLKKYEVHDTGEVRQSINLLENNQYDLIILDNSGLELMLFFDKINENRISIPIILNSLSSGNELPYLKQKVIKDPPNNVLLLKKINQLFETEKHKILLIINEQIFSYSLSVFLTQNNYDIYLANNAKEGLKKCFGVVPDMIIVSDTLEDMKIEEILEELENHHLTKDIFTFVIREKTIEDYDALSKFKAEVIDKNNGVEYIVSRINENLKKYKEVEAQ